ncbi:MAG: MATE family efflux transporter [Longimicrobiales bacterium]
MNRLSSGAAATAPERIRLSRFYPAGPEFKELTALALPVVAVQVGLVFQGVVDTLMVGRVSPADLAAVALGNLYFFAVSVFGMGVLFALDPLISQAFGAKDEEAIELGMQRGLVLALGLTALASVLLALAGPVLTVLGQPAEVVPIASRYAWALIPGMLPFYGFIVFRQALQAVGRVAPIVVTIVLANVFNGFANWLLIFGNWGAPPLGAVGSGWATSASRWFMLLGILALGRKTLLPYLARFRHEVFERAPLRAILRLGAPIGLHFVLEFGAFGAIGIVMGWLGTVPMAGHQIAINLASLTFMVPVGISQAASVLVGQAVGANQADRARRFAGASVCLGCLVMTASAALFLWAPEFLSELYTGDAQVLAVAAVLIPVAGVFQIADGLQVVCSGILRGVGDTVRPLLLNVLGFWLIGMPISLLLGFRTDAGPVGLWWGLAAGLGAVAIMLLARVWSRFRRPLLRLDF